METKTKIIIGVSGALALALVAYFTRNAWMPKKDDATTIPPADVPVAPEHVLPQTYNVPVATPTPPSDNKETDRTMVGATTLLSGGLNLGANKGLYAGLDGLRISDLNNNLAFKTKKGQRVGTIYAAEKSGTNIVIKFIGSGGVKLKTVSQGMNIK